jgi:transcriptional regulator with XRE-family HTH domain
MTLRDLAQKTNLSPSFLSQLERGMTTVAVDSLQDISHALGVDLSYFLNVLKNAPSELPDQIIRSYERPVSFIEAGKFIHHYLSGHLSDSSLFPEIILLLPEPDLADVKSVVFSHKGDEFVHVLKGSLTVNYHGEIHTMREGDSFLFKAATPHNWYNATLQTTEILVVHSPSPFLSAAPPAE